MFRILPFLIILLVMMIGSKILDILEISSSLNVVGVTPLNAQEPEAKKEKPAEETKKESDQKEPKEKSGEEKKTDSKDGEPPKKDDLIAAQVEKPTEEEIDSSAPKKYFTKTELDLLQSLSARKKELDEREKSISLKENSLSVIETTISSKLKDLQNLQSDLNNILKQYEQKEDEKIKSLVRVYESMKPNEAAKIFDQLQMSILLEVAVRMKEQKLAQIIAKMDTYKAKELTVELANRRKVKSN